MSDQMIPDSLTEMFIFETEQMLQQLEETILNCEQEKQYTAKNVNEIFRFMHTIKGSASMMFYDQISSLAHVTEDLFSYFREQKLQIIDSEHLTDLILECIDFIKSEIKELKSDGKMGGDSSLLIDRIKHVLHTYQSGELVSNPVTIEGYMYQITIKYEDGCQMENIRAYQLIHELQGLVIEMNYAPSDILENESSVEVIREQGFQMMIRIDMDLEQLRNFFRHISFVEECIITQFEGTQPEGFNMDQFSTSDQDRAPKENESTTTKYESCATHQVQSVISVHVSKLDALMDLVGEMVLSGSMVFHNPELKNNKLVGLQKATIQLQKIINEMQDMVMSIRMVPLSTTFQKMNRIVRDASKKLNKQVQFEIIGEDTEVDKNIIEHISDPLMHLVRNAIDHGIETVEERMAKGKHIIGEIRLEAQQSGGDVHIIVSDNGRGLDRNKILAKARNNGLLTKSEDELLDKEIYSLIFLPGFSTKEEVTEYSGRGVGMDVVTQNIQKIGGSIFVDSQPDEGTTITIQIPLTLSIINGMIIRVGNSKYMVPITSIRESFRPQAEDIFKTDPEHEMVMVRGKCYSILRLHRLFHIDEGIQDIGEAILMMVESEHHVYCLLADELLGEQQVVVKPLPDYIKNHQKIHGISGCTILGDGSISLILDIKTLSV